ncbi:hypothetical protein ACFFLS_03570 [Flavobacterium procerum]|uniref:Uncharacterized protein n=1 Tax=Flavobacterium procerum TaxID=1455569 RepID=A0ABV6BKY7_9FLAO
MRTNFKILLVIITLLVVVVMSYFAFIYFFTKEPKPIEVYTFSMPYKELENRIQKEMKKKSDSNIKIDSSFTTRYVTLGKNNDSYFFITNIDKNKSKEYNKKAWIELQTVVDSNFTMLDVFYENKNQYSDKIKIFKEDFIDKLKND